MIQGINMHNVQVLGHINVFLHIKWAREKMCHEYKDASGIETVFHLQYLPFIKKK